MAKMTSREFRRVMEHFGWTQDSAAVELGRSSRSIHGWCNGARIPVIVQKFLRLIVNRRIKPSDPAMETPVE